MGIFGSIVKSFVPGLGEYEAGEAQKDAIEAQKDANKDAARLKFRTTITQAQYDERTNRERATLERDATVEQATLEQRQAKAAIDLSARAIAAQIEGERNKSAIGQTKMAREARFATSAARAQQLTSGLVYEGSGRAFVDQAAAFAELDRLNFAYENEIGVRGLLFDRAGQMLKGRQADEVTEFTVRHATLAADMTLRQALESLDLTRAAALEARDFEVKNAATTAKAEKNFVTAQTGMNIASSVIGSGTRIAALGMRIW